MQWAIPPAADSNTSITMTAVTATDDSGIVVYEFDETSGNPGGTGSVQSSPVYTDTGLAAGNQYCYRVRARDESGNATGWSPEVCVTLGGTGQDTNAPAPPPTMIMGPNNTTADVNTGSGQFQWAFDYNWWHKIVVDVTGITDDVSPTTAIEVKFICTSDGSFSSDSKIPAPLRPIYIGTPVSFGGQAEGYRVTFNGSIIVYDVDVNKWGGTGKILNWRVCVYDANGNAACSATHTIGPP
jgi:hypothetical protein